MATWTKIPETNIAGTLSTAVSKLVSSVSTPIEKSLSKMEVKIEDIQKEADDLQKEIRVIQDKTEQIILEKESKNEMSSTGGGGYASFLQTATGGAAKGTTIKNTVDEEKLLQETSIRVKRKVDKFNSSSRLSISSMRRTLDAANRSVNSVLKILTTLRAVVVSLKVPIPPFEIIIKIIKMLPIPQRYLIVSFTILESDLLEMLEQLIAQAKEEINSIEQLIVAIEGILKPIRDRIEQIRAQLNLLSLECSIAGASTQDQRILEMYGFIDSSSGDNLFNKIQKGISGGGQEIGGARAISYGIAGLDLSKPELANQLALADPGDIIGLEGKPTGSFIQTWFCSSSVQPEVPAGFPQVSGSWTLKPLQAENLENQTERDIDSLWKLDLKVTGKGSIFGGLNDTPEKATGEDLKATRQGADLGTDFFKVLDETNFDQKPGILKVSDWNGFMETAIDKLKELPLTQDFKDELVDVWNEVVTEAKGTDEKEVQITKYQWRSKTGEIYNLEILEDDHSPAVAKRRFVRVTDQAGTVIMDGLKTFSVDTESLLQEIKMQLDQLTQ